MKIFSNVIPVIGFFLVFKTVWSQQPPFRVMTYNIRYDEPRDGPDQWELRKEDVVELLKQQKPAILGIQEGLHHQVTFIASAFSGQMVYTGAGRDDGHQKGEYCALFIDTTVFTIQENYTFWLSETPEKPSVGWDAALPRIATCVKVHHKESNRNIWVCNTHFDHMGKLARFRSAALISEKVRSWAGNSAPVIIMGDLNCEPHEEPWKELSEHFKDARISSETMVSGPTGTFQAFGKEEARRRIDYIFVKNLRVLTQEHLDEKRPEGRFPSDHFPVTAEISFF